MYARLACHRKRAVRSPIIAVARHAPPRELNPFGHSHRRPVVEHAAAPFAAWESFYVIVGSSAGALTGLQFVVVALSADSRVIKRTELAMLAFGAPTIVHFCAVLLTAAVLSTPWASFSGAQITLAIAGAAGVGYTGIVIRRAL